jgi:uncharacterized protein (TIGR02996 family)
MACVVAPTDSLYARFVSSLVDPKPFESAMPAEIRKLVAQARRGNGPLVPWLAGKSPGYGQVGDCQALLYGRPELSNEVLGWVVGITMFDDDLNILPDHVAALNRNALIPFAVDAFVAGIFANVPTMKRQWVSIEKLIGRLESVPASVLPIVPIGCMLDQGLHRGAAVRIAHRIGEPAREALREARKTATKGQARRIDDALAVLDMDVKAASSAPETDLLERLVAAWRQTHDPALEEPIAQLGAAVARQRGALVAKSKSELEGAWVVLAANNDPADLDRLLDTPWPAAWKTALKRIEALAKRDPDPRIARALLRIVTTYPSLGSEPLHKALARLVAASPSLAALPAIDAIENTRRRTTAQIYKRARDAIALEGRAAADPALLAEAAVPTSKSVDLDGLRTEAMKHPGDLGLRLVLADALQQAGDPRGELIALQCAIADGTADAKARARASALLAAHIDTWTGPLPGVTRASREFERGFLVGLATNAETPALLETVDRPEWLTVEKLAAAYAGPKLASLFHRMPLLRCLTVQDATTIEALARLGAKPSIIALGVLSTWLDDLSAFPRLRVLAGFWFTSPVRRARFLEHQQRAAAAGLHAIVHIGFPLAHLDAAVLARASGPPETRFGIETYSPSFEPDGWRLRTTRDSTRADLAWAGGGAHLLADAPRIVSMLEAGGITEVSIHVAGRSRKSVEQAIGRLATGAPHIAVGFDGAPIDLAALPPTGVTVR